MSFGLDVGNDRLPMLPRNNVSPEDALFLAIEADASGGMSRGMDDAEFNISHSDSIAFIEGTLRYDAVDLDPARQAVRAWLLEVRASKAWM